MIVNYCICDRCQDPIPEGTGAQVLKSTDAKGVYQTMHMCDKCFGEVFTASADKIISKLKKGEMK